MDEAMMIVLLGVGATATMDVCTYALDRLGAVPFPNYGLVGRWVGHMTRGRFRHAAIGAAPPVRAERLIGLATHYVVGVALAGVLIGLFGGDWLQRPSAAPAFIVGLVSVVLPFLVMQPGMGLGLAATKTPNPRAARLRSLLNHLLFGFGLYAAGLALSLLRSP